MTAAVAVVLVVAVLILAVGRWERSRHADEQNAGIERVSAAVGPLGGPTLAGFRMLEDFQCLIYRRDGRTFALEVCVDREGRVIEAIDRRAGRKIWSLREDPSRTRVRVDRAGFERVIVRLCADCRAVFERARQPGGQARD